MGAFEDGLHGEMFSFANLAVSIINDKSSALHAELLSRLGRASLLPNDTLNIIATDSKCERGGGVRAALAQSNECGTALAMETKERSKHTHTRARTHAHD